MMDETVTIISVPMGTASQNEAHKPDSRADSSARNRVLDRNNRITACDLKIRNLT